MAYISPVKSKGCEVELEPIDQDLAYNLLKNGNVDEFEARLRFWDPTELVFGKSLLHWATYYRTPISYYNANMVRISSILLKSGVIVTPEVLFNLKVWTVPELEVISNFIPDELIAAKKMKNS
jgi:hypothetical protein